MDKASKATAEISLAHDGWDPVNSMRRSCEADEALILVPILIQKSHDREDGQHDTVGDDGGGIGVDYVEEILGAVAH